MKSKKISMPIKIGIALALGIIAGLVCYFGGFPQFTTNYLKPFGTIFINLLKFIVVPVDMIMIVYGIDRLFDMGRTALNTTRDIACSVCVNRWESRMQN